MTWIAALLPVGLPVSPDALMVLTTIVLQTPTLVGVFRIYAALARQSQAHEDMARRIGVLELRAGVRDRAGYPPYGQ